MWELFERGGPLMWPILACSIVAVAAFVDRLLATRRKAVMPDTVYRALMAHLEARDLGAAEALLRGDPSPMARTLLSGVRHRTAGRDVMKKAMEDVGALALGRLERFLGVLGTSAAIAPLLGLLGTVGGMIEVFGQMELMMDPEMSVLAGGIWKALITTGFGLTVAIPILIGQRYVEARLDRYAHELDEHALALVDRLDPLP